MATGITEAVEGGKVVRLYLDEPMLPGVTFTRKGVRYRVTGDGEMAEPVSPARIGPPGRVGVDVTVLAWAGAFALGWFFLTRRR